MGYTWLGMRKLTWEEVLQRHEKGELAGCFRLYDDNSEAMIDRGYDFAGDILAHHKKGGEFGEDIDTVDLELADGKKITAPAVVDVCGKCSCHCTWYFTVDHCHICSVFIFDSCCCTCCLKSFCCGHAAFDLFHFNLHSCTAF